MWGIYFRVGRRRRFGPPPAIFMANVGTAEEEEEGWKGEGDDGKREETHTCEKRKEEEEETSRARSHDKAEKDSAIRRWYTYQEYYAWVGIGESPPRICRREVHMTRRVFILVMTCTFCNIYCTIFLKKGNDFPAGNRLLTQIRKLSSSAKKNFEDLSHMPRRGESEKNHQREKNRSSKKKEEMRNSLLPRPRLLPLSLQKGCFEGTEGGKLFFSAGVALETTGGRTQVSQKPKTNKPKKGNFPFPMYVGKKEMDAP